MVTNIQQWAKMGKRLLEYERRLPIYVGGIAVEFFKGSFDRQGFIEGRSLQQWSERKTSVLPERNKSRRQLMIRSGRLRRSIRITGTGRDYVIVGTDVPYARIHNEGGTIEQNNITVTPKMKKLFFAMYYHTGDEKYRAMALSKTINRKFTIPPRKFIGESRFLMDRIEMRIARDIENMFNEIFKS